MMECKVIGTLHNADIQTVHELLRSMSHSPVDRIAYHEIILKDPQRMRAPPKVRLQCPLPTPVSVRGKDDVLLEEMTTTKDESNCSWIMRHEGAPMRSSEATALPATVMEVLESHLKGSRGSIEAFWTSTMGLKLDHALMKDGNRYQLEHDDFDIEVLICRLRKLPDPMKPENAKYLVHNNFIVEIIAKSSKKDFREAAKAVGSFAEQLVPYVECQKAA
ncbi:hypothetical protein BSKO_03517 [Bryopsis sp. KO-2023]|nr:hypothetical protein BSKO_03517 [Bryopsis sp. KO-2023]